VQQSRTISFAIMPQLCARVRSDKNNKHSVIIITIIIRIIIIIINIIIIIISIFVIIIIILIIIITIIIIMLARVVRPCRGTSNTHPSPYESRGHVCRRVNRRARVFLPQTFRFQTQLRVATSDSNI
jgi:hypothetical protein